MAEARPLILVAEALVQHPGSGFVLVVLNTSGTWSFPAGRVDDGESLGDAVVRETMEETGISVEPLGVVAVTDRVDDGRHDVVVTFECRFVEDTKAPIDDEIAEVAWVAPGQANELMPHLEEQVRDLLAAEPVAYRSSLLDQ